MDTDEEKSREECAGTQKSMAAEYNVPIRDTPGNKEEERSESYRKKEDVAQSTMETNIERNRKKSKELNRGFLVQGGILKSIEELDTSEITWKKDKFDEGQKRPVKVKASLATDKIKVAKGRNFIVIMQSLRLLKVQYDQINMINHRAAEVRFRNVNDANLFLKAVEQNKEVGLKTSIDRREISVRGVITDWPDSILEFWEAVREKEEILKIKK